MVTKKRNKPKSSPKSNQESLTGVWSGSIARLRVYDTQTSTGNVMAYKAPGTNSDGVGSTTDSNIIKALFLARDNGRTITGFTNPANRIVWLDY
ncbi:MAG TPA: hypothetical protein VNF70_01590 [Pyrinomonadaceae bacterium]|nr:hypothetical protein [Pyrinomonadaceae bacterium]